MWPTGRTRLKGWMANNTPSEAVAIGRLIEQREKPGAAERLREGGRLGAKITNKINDNPPSGTLPEGAISQPPVREMAAKAVGMDPVGMLGEIVSMARKHAPEPARTWFTTAGENFFRSAARLDECLGLAARPTERKPLTVARYQMRNEALRAALALCGDAEALLDEINRFEAVDWPLLQSVKKPPRGASPIQRNLFAAFAVGLPIPRTARRIEQIRDCEMTCRML